MSKENIILTLDTAISEINEWNRKYVSITNYVDTKIMVLNLLKKEFQEKDSNEIDTLILRAFKDICSDIARNWEGYNFHDLIFTIYDELCINNPNFNLLEGLGGDFMKLVSKEKGDG